MQLTLTIRSPKILTVLLTFITAVVISPLLKGGISFETIVRSETGESKQGLFDEPFQWSAWVRNSLASHDSENHPASDSNARCAIRGQVQSPPSVSNRRLYEFATSLIGLHWSVNAQGSSYCQDVACNGSFAVSDLQDCPPACEGFHPWYYSDVEHSSPDLGWKTNGQQVCAACAYCREIRCER